MHAWLVGVMVMAAVDVGQVAATYVGFMRGGNFADAALMHDGPMKQALSSEKLAATLKQVLGGDTLGECVEDARTAVGAAHVVVMNCAAGDKRWHVKVTVNHDGKVGGLFFSPAPAQAGGFSDARYVKPQNFKESPITLKSGRFELPAVISVPVGKGPFPAVVLVHGSGPHDEDETIGPNKPFRDLAQGLASRGIVVLRYQKRTLKYGAESAEKKGSLTVQDETVADAVSAARMLRALPNASAVVVVGHSLGGNMIARIGRQCPEATGLVSLAGNVSPLEELMVAQVNYIGSLQEPSAEEKKALQGIRDAAAKVKDIKADSAPVLGVPASYWLDLKGYNPAADAATLQQPILFLQGARDYQVPPSELELWKSGLKGKKLAEFKTYPGLNHLFMKGTGPSVPAEYAVPGHVEEAVVVDLAAFVMNHSVR